MPTCTAAAPPADDPRYLALKAKDARFDGRFFTGVTSTGIYCRPVCRVRTPKAENCRFFTLAAQAESAGFRPCLRCRPELAPASNLDTDVQPWSTQDASSILAVQAAQLLDQIDQWGDQHGEATPSMDQVAQRLGVSARHMRRIFEGQWGVSPLQYLQTRRLLTAKQLLTDTTLPIAQVAALSGYASVRRFNAVFAQHYRLQPRALRDSTGQRTAPPGVLLRAAYRPPYDVAAMLQFFAKRSLDGVELVDLAQQSYARTVCLQVGKLAYTGWVQVQFVPQQCAVQMRVSESLAAVLPTVRGQLKALLDLDADPDAIHQVLGASFPTAQGLRVPGTLDGFELGVRAILGQQITVQAARTLAARLVERFGEDVATPFTGLHRLFPTAHALAAATGDALGALGIVRQRQAAIQSLAQAVAHGGLALHPSSPVPATMAALQALPGIGPWTAHYIAMRALRWPDAFPAGDVALHRALGVQDAKQPAQAAELASNAWKPWRSYAVLRAWNTL